MNGQHRQICFRNKDLAGDDFPLADFRYIWRTKVKNLKNILLAGTAALMITGSLAQAEDLTAEINITYSCHRLNNYFRPAEDIRSQLEKLVPDRVADGKKTAWRRTIPEIIIQACEKFPADYVDRIMNLAVEDLLKDPGYIADTKGHSQVVSAGSLSHQCYDNSGDCGRQESAPAVSEATKEPTETCGEFSNPEAKETCYKQQEALFPGWGCCGLDGKPFYAKSQFKEGKIVNPSSANNEICKTDWRACSDNVDMAKSSIRYFREAQRACVDVATRNGLTLSKEPFHALNPGYDSEAKGEGVDGSIRETGGKVLVVDNFAGVPLTHIQGMVKSVRAFCVYNFSTSQVERFHWVNWQTTPYENVNH
jgi:hypothetical protein